MLEPADLGYHDMVSDVCQGPTDLTSMHLLPYPQDMLVSSDASIDNPIGLELPVSLDVDVGCKLSY